MIRNFYIVLLALTTVVTKAQLVVDADVRFRFEYRHGYGSLFPANADPAAFIGQRSRLNTGYHVKKLDFFLSVQDIRVWGDVPQLNSKDLNGPSLHQAWVRLALGNYFAVKVGRQEVIYNDHRFFGNVDWALQGRSHDLVLFTYSKEAFRADVGIAYNQNLQKLVGNEYEGSYKTFQYFWLHKDWTALSGSLLFLNNGVEYPSVAARNIKRGVFYTQTLGMHLNYHKSKWNWVSNIFYQFGTYPRDNDLSAYLFSLDLFYQVFEKWNTGLGVELISGNHNGDVSGGKNNAFNPLYGTNHKFNGYMDYFYVGNHINNVGLVDFYLTEKIQLHPRLKIGVALHAFWAAADMPGNRDRALGEELDLTITHKIQEKVDVQIGYSHLFPTDEMKLLKDVNTDVTTAHNWLWVMLVAKPTLFKGKHEE